MRAVAQFRHPHLIEMRPIARGAPAAPTSTRGGPTAAPAQEDIGFEPDLAGGVRLSELCRSRFGSGPVPLSFGLRILLGALSGMAALHGSSLGFAHGEAAPCNIVVGSDGNSRLVPLVAAHWHEGAPPSADATGYVAPERLRGDPFDHRADVFSSGVMLWEMITGRSFRGLPAEIITAWVVDGKVPDPVHPDDAPWVVLLARVASRALAVNPGDRWPHVGVLGAEIENVAEGHIASRKEVVDLLADATDSKTSASHSENPWTPSLSPTAVSIPPLRIPPLPPVREEKWLDERSAGPPSARASVAPRRSEKSRRRQSRIAWSALAAALVLVGLAAHEVLDMSRASRRASAVASPSPVVRAPVSSTSVEPVAVGADLGRPPVAVGADLGRPPVAVGADLGRPPVAVGAAFGPPPKASPSASAANPENAVPPDKAPAEATEPLPRPDAVPPARRPGLRRAPARKAPASPPPTPKNFKPRDDAFGI